MAAAAENVTAEAKQESFSFGFQEAPSIYKVGHAELLPVQNGADSTPEPPELTPSATLLASVGEILSSRLTTPATEAEIAEMLAVTKSQVKAWLTRLVERGTLKKLKKPVRYQAAKA